MERDEYELWDFTNALKSYRNQSIEMSIACDDPIIRMFAIINRRTGNRALIRIMDTVDALPEWLKALYEARMKAEGIIL